MLNSELAVHLNILREVINPEYFTFISLILVSVSL